VLAQAVPGAVAAEALATLVDEDGLGARRVNPSAGEQMAKDGTSRAGSSAGHRRRGPALAKVDIMNLEPARLAEAQPGRIEQDEERPAVVRPQRPYNEEPLPA
jgi:hypothetical protein